jgi:hypothetical protein
MNTTATAVSDPPSAQLSRRQHAWKEFRDLFRGDEERHRRLHGRLLAVLAVSFALDLVIASVLFLVDKGLGRNFGRAFIYTTEQIVTGGSSFSVTSWWGHSIEVFLGIYMVTVVAAIAGSFASYFTSA